MCGSTATHVPHQVAQNSRTTTFPRSFSQSATAPTGAWSRPSRTIGGALVSGAGGASARVAPSAGAQVTTLVRSRTADMAAVRESIWDSTLSWIALDLV